MILSQILQPSCIKVPLTGKNKKAVISELINLLDNNGLLLDKNVVLDAVMTREKTRSTGIGAGIALPHGKCKGVDKLVMAIGIANKPIDFASIDGKPVKIIILLISSVDQTGPHIQALAKISKLMLDEQFKQKFEEAKSAQELYKLLSQKESNNNHP